MQTKSKRHLATFLFGLVWVLALSLGLRSLLSYETAPGRIGVVPSSWPLSSKLRLSPNQQTLLMFAHPHCPCTRASVGELAELLAQVEGKVRAYVIFLKPDESGPDWDDTALRKSAGKIPNVTVLSDVDGAEARRFGAETSGHTLLFDSRGHLLFSGGITASRGHAGANAGESAIVALINRHVADRAKTLVFGCSLFGPTDNKKEEPCRN